MDAGDVHNHAHALDARRADHRRRMLAALAINLAMLVAQFVGGLLTNSLALLADAGHLLSDVAAIGIGLFAVTVAARPGGPRQTFGYQRTEVLAALVNGLTLVALAVVIVVAALNRLGDAPAVAGVGVIVLGLIGAAGNVLATVVLAGGQREDINLEAVLRHSFADVLGSLAVVVAGVVIVTTGWTEIDPIASITIAVLIALSSWRLVVEPINVLLEAAPAGLDVTEIGKAMSEAETVVEVHDLHVWALTPGFPALSAHVIVELGADRDRARIQLEALLRERFDIEHTTLQVGEAASGELLQIE